MKGFNFSYPLTIVDTPGFDVTQGKQRDRIISKQIHTFFSQSGEHGIDHLDSVEFAVQCALTSSSYKHNNIYLIQCYHYLEKM